MLLLLLFERLNTLGNSLVTAIAWFGCRILRSCAGNSPYFGLFDVGIIGNIKISSTFNVLDLISKTDTGSRSDGPNLNFNCGIQFDEDP